MLSQVKRPSERGSWWFESILARKPKMMIKAKDVYTEAQRIYLYEYYASKTIDGVTKYVKLGETMTKQEFLQKLSQYKYASKYFEGFVTDANKQYVKFSKPTDSFTMYWTETAEFDFDAIDKRLSDIQIPNGFKVVDKPAIINVNKFALGISTQGVFGTYSIHHPPMGIQWLDIDREAIVVEESLKGLVNYRYNFSSMVTPQWPFFIKNDSL